MPFAKMTEVSKYKACGSRGNELEGHARQPAPIPASGWSHHGRAAARPHLHGRDEARPSDGLGPTTASGALALQQQLLR